MLYWRFPALYNIGSHLPFKSTCIVGFCDDVLYKRTYLITNLAASVCSSLVFDWLVGVSWPVGVVRAGSVQHKFVGCRRLQCRVQWTRPRRSDSHTVSTARHVTRWFTRWHREGATQLHSSTADALPCPRMYQWTSAVTKASHAANFGDIYVFFQHIKCFCSFFTPRNPNCKNSTHAYS